MVGIFSLERKISAVYQILLFLSNTSVARKMTLSLHAAIFPGGPLICKPRFGLVLVTKPNLGLQISGPPGKIAACKDKVIFLATEVFDRKSKIWYTAEIFLSSEKIPTIEDLCEILSVSRPTAVDYI